MDKNSKIYVAGHRGMVGSAIVRQLLKQGYNNIITADHKHLDLTRQDQVEKFFSEVFISSISSLVILSIIS